MRTDPDETTLSLLKAYEQSEDLAFKHTTPLRTAPKKRLRMGAVSRFLRRNLLLILATTLGVSGLVFYLVWRQPRQYEGEFQLLVEPLHSEGRLKNTAASSPNQPAEGVDYATLIRLLKSPTVLNEIIGTIQARYADLDYSRLMGALNIERVEDPAGKTKLIGVSYQDSDLQQINFVLEQLASGYIQYSEEERQTYLGEGISFISKKLPEARQNVANLEKQLQELQQRYRITDPETEGAGLAQQARDLEAKRLEVQRNLQAQKSLYANLQGQLGLAPSEAIAASSLTENPRYQQLIGELKQVETEIAAQAATLTDDNPLMQDLRAKQRNLKTLLNQETSNLATQNLAGNGSTSNVPSFQGSLQRGLSQQLVAALNEIQVLEVQSQAAQQASEVVDKKLQQFPAIQRRYNEIQRQLGVATKALNQLLENQENLKVEDAQQQIPWQLAVNPEIRRDPNGNPLPLGQSRSTKLALGALGGLLLGIGLALLREKRQNVFHSTADLKDETQLPLLGALPFSETASVLENNHESSGLHAPSNPSHQKLRRAAEALYAKLKFLNSEIPIQSLVVSSVTSRDGKTTAAMHLAQVAASMGQRVLLVDANMAMPQLHSYLGMPNFEGLSEILHKKLDPTQYIQRSPYHANLFILSSGQSLAGASQLLASAQMQYLMGQFQNMFDLVVYDTAHLLDYTDAQYLSWQADGLLLVVGMGRTQHSLVLKALKSLRGSRLPILGTVANFANGTTDVIEGGQPLEVGRPEDEFEIFRV